MTQPNQCPKCGGRSRALFKDCFIMTPTALSCEQSRCPIGEHLHRICEGCGYWWPEACLDSKSKDVEIEE